MNINKQTRVLTTGEEARTANNIFAPGGVDV